METVTMGLANIVKLDGTNYNTWSIRCELLLKGQGLWDIVINPISTCDLDSNDTEDRKTIEQFNKDNGRALCLIGLTLADSQLIHMKNISSANECWVLLRNLYVRSSVSSVISLTRKLFLKKFCEPETMIEHLTFMKACLLQLSEKQMEFSESQKAFIILTSLPKDFDQLVNNLDIFSPEELNVNDITSRILEFYQRLQERNDFCAGKTAGTVLPCKPGLQKVKCHVCKQFGHFAKNCLQTKRPRSCEKRDNVFVSLSRNVNREAWILDSGASDNIVCSKKLFKKFKQCNRQVSLANGCYVRVVGEGEVSCNCLSVHLTALCVPTIRYNLLSVSSLIKQGFEVCFKNNRCVIKRGEKQCTVAERDGLFVLTNETVFAVNSGYQNKTLHDRCIHLLHRQLGHCSFKALKETIPKTTGLKLLPCKRFLDCNVCSKVKLKSTPVRINEGFKANNILEVVAIDLIGPMRAGYRGNKYILSIVDVFSRYGFCYLLKSKMDTFRNIKNWIMFVERKTNKKVRCIVSDNGSEFTNTRFVNFLAENGIEHRRTAPHRPTHNAICERRGQTLQNMVRAMIADSNLPKGLWEEAVMCASHTLNNIVHSTTHDTPHFLWHGKRPCLDYVHVFGSPAWVHIPAASRRKGDDRAHKCYFVGYEANHKSYRFWDATGRKIVRSASARFQESVGWARIEQETGPDVLELSEDLFQWNRVDTPQRAVKEEPRVSSDDTQRGGDQGDQDVVTLRRTTRISKPPDRYQAHVGRGPEYEPTRVSDIKTCTSEVQLEWKKAMKRELVSLSSFKGDEEVPVPKRKDLVKRRRVCKVKEGIGVKAKPKQD